MSPPSPESTPITTGVSDDLRLPALNKAGHVAHCVRCLAGLPASLVEMDASRCAYIYLSFLTPPFSPNEGRCAYVSDWLFFFFPEWRSRFIVWARSTSQAWQSRRYRRRIARAGKSGSGINMSVRAPLAVSLFSTSFADFWGFFVHR
jgi:hypothetical protein